MNTESIYSDELLLLAETLGEVKTRTEKLESEFSTQAKPLEAATNALSAALGGIKALQFHVLDNNLGALSARVEEMRKAVDEQVGVIALELKKADETNAAKAGADAEALRSEIGALQAQLGSLVTQFGQQLERVEFAAKEEAKKLQLIPGPAGAPGASLNPRGVFVDGETYNRLDVVSWLGSSYIAAVDGVTEKPSKNSNQWQVLASRGGGAAGGAGDFGSLAGVAQINQGGTGQTTRVAALNALLPDQAGSTQYMLLTDGSGTVSWGAQPVAGLPSQTSNSGRLLTTNGTSASWSNAVTVSGSNATVGGTLTVSGVMNTSTIVANGPSGLSLDTTGSASLRFSDSSVSKWWIYKLPSDVNLYFRDAVNARMQMVMEPGATAGTALTQILSNVTIAGTTDSTTKDTGCLVLEGGLGVEKNAWIGKEVHVNSTGYLTGNAKLNVYATPADTGYLYGIRLSDNSTATLALALQNPTGTTSGFIHSNVALGLGTAGVSAVNITTGQQVQVLASTASTSTSSGALVVSGGVGVAGAVYTGGALTVGKDGSSISIYLENAGAIRMNTASPLYIDTKATDGGDIYLRPRVGNALILSAGTNLATFGGAVKTPAPSGSTAGEWKLGAAATVSPTSPNRTIAIDIGGTVYYLHAKTTND